MKGKSLVMSIFMALATGGLFAQEAPGYENAPVPMPAERDGFLAAVGSGIAANASRSRENVDYRFWSQIHAGPWGFVDTRYFELSLGLVVGRMARRNRWCFLILAANSTVFWKAPVGIFGISPLLGIGLDAVFWAREECLRTEATVSGDIDGSVFTNFSSMTLKAGFGRDFGFSGDRFFRVRAIGYYGRRLGNPHPWGGTLRLGIGRRL